MTGEEESYPAANRSILVVSLILVLIAMVGSFVVVAVTSMTYCGENNSYADISAVTNACRNVPDVLFWLWIFAPPVLTIIAGAVALDRNRWRPLVVG